MLLIIVPLLIGLALQTIKLPENWNNPLRTKIKKVRQRLRNVCSTELSTKDNAPVIKVKRKEK